MAKKRLKKKTRRVLSNIILVFALALGIFSGFQLWKEHQKYAVAKKSYDDLKDTVVVKPVGRAEITTEKDVFTPRKEIDWEALREIDQNVVAWIELKDSSIDYPVAHCDNNNQYVRHLLGGRYSDAGTIFIDYRNKGDFTDRNTVIYGHHMLDEPLMFAEVENYEKQSYYDSHKVFMIHTPDAEYEMYPVAGYKTTGTGGYLEFEFGSDDDYEKYIGKFIDKSTFKSDEKIGKNDQMVLLSTCSYDVTNGRFVLIGKLVLVDSVKMHEHVN